VRLPQERPAFACDPCSKGFRTAELLQAHVEDHETCPQCPFSACAALVKEHRLLHTPRVQALIHMTAEEVTAWREERRRNWPTEENVRRKRDEAQQKREEQSAEKTSHKRAAPEQKKKPESKPRDKKTGNATGREKKGPPKRARGLLENLFSAERRMEADLLVQCFEHWADKAAE
jgi:hypothetical protein